VEAQPFQQPGQVDIAAALYPKLPVRLFRSLARIFASGDPDFLNLGESQHLDAVETAMRPASTAATNSSADC
jgi:hypothetical protein